jgi:hypothetical protein
MLEMVSVNSSTIESIGYEPGSKRLHVNFLSTEKFIYQGVPQIIHARLMRAHSKEDYLADEITGKYRHTEIY